MKMPNPTKALKTTVLFCCCLLLQANLKAQWVTIPDSNFVNWLNAAGYASCMNGNQMDTTCPTVVNATQVRCDSASITNLTGIQYFDNLVTLTCELNSLTSLPALPPNLDTLDCSRNQITSITTLPPGLIAFTCNQNQLTSLPPLPQSLILLSCIMNQLTQLPEFTDSLFFLDCSYNPDLNCLPDLKNLYYLDIWGTGITCLPNYGKLFMMDANSLPVSLCDGSNNPNGCQALWNIHGRIYTDIDGTCDFDASQDIVPQPMEVQLWGMNGTLLRQTHSIFDGRYSFDTDSFGTYQLRVVPAPPTYCGPVGGVTARVVSATDSLHSNVDFPIYTLQNLTINASPPSGCAPQQVLFTYSSPSGYVATEWAWFLDFPNPFSMDSIATFTFDTPGVYTVLLYTNFSDPLTFDSASITISVGTVSLTATVQPADCGMCNGSISLIASNGIAPFVYQWADTSFWPVTHTRTGLCAGVYTASAIDNGGCIGSGSFTVPEGPGTCTDGDLCTVDSCLGGVCFFPPVVCDDADACTNDACDNGICLFTSISCDDGDVCTVDTCINGVCENPSIISIAMNSTFATPGNCDGTANAIASGGTPPYVYQWNPAVSCPSNCIGLCDGISYALSVTDSNGCLTVDSIDVSARLWIQQSAISGCAPLQVQFADSTTAGYGVQSWLWDLGDGNTSTNPTPVGIYTTPGVYTISLIVTNAAGPDTTSTTLIVHGSPDLALSDLDMTCFGWCNGQIDATVSGGNPPYLYQWLTGQVTEDITGLCPGVYELLVTDSLGCVKADTAFITQPAMLSLTVVPTVASINICDGQVSAVVTGGTQPYTFGLITENGDTVCNTLQCQGLCGGNYFYFVIDANGCSNTRPVVLGRNSGPATGPEQDCFYAIPVCDPIIIQTKSYQGTGQVEDIENSNSCLQNGENNTVWYIFEIGDSGTLEFTITPVDSIGDDYDFALYDLTNAACSDIINGGLEVRCNYAFTGAPVTVTGLKAGYTGISEDANGQPFCAPLDVVPGQRFVLVVDNFSSTQSGFILDFTPGTAPLNYPYSAEITNAGVLACSDSLLSVTMSERIACSLLNSDGSNFTVSGPSQITILGASSYDCAIGNRTNKFTLHYSGVFLPGQAYQIETNFNDTTAYCGSIPLDTFSFSADSVVAGIEVSIEVVTPVYCPTDLSGALSAIVTGGLPPYNYSWSSQSTDAAILNIPQGTYSVTVTDALGCSAADTITFLAIDATCVWPGDANADGIANNLDILAIGIGYGSTGFPRIIASNQWFPQFSSDWMDTLITGANYKHIDCDGDGIVNFSDTIAVSANYGLTHAKGDQRCALAPPLYVDLPDTLVTGQVVAAPIILGSVNDLVTGLYGVAFSVYYDNNLIDTNSVRVSFNDGWMGVPGVDLLGFSKDLYLNGKADAAVTRIDHVNLPQSQGRIGTFSFTIKDDVSGKQGAVPLLVSIDNVTAIDVAENPVFVCGAPDSTTALVFTTDEKDIVPAYLKVYPNPADNTIYVEANQRIESTTLTDLLGRDVLTTQPGMVRTQLAIADVAKGAYLLRLEFANSVVVRKILIY